MVKLVFGYGQVLYRRRGKQLVGNLRIRPGISVSEILGHSLPHSGVAVYRTRPKEDLQALILYTL